MTIMAVSAAHSLYALSDSAVVESIKAYSDLNQSDVDRWKLLWLGGLAEPTATAASAYGMYKVYQEAQNITPSQQALDKLLRNEWYLSILGDRKPSERMQSWITSKRAWAGAGVVGAGVLAYKLLYPRIQAGILAKVKKYVALCGQLAVTQKMYLNDIVFRQALELPGNTVWTVSGPVAVGYGFQNLIEQGNIALLLIDQLISSGGSFDVEELNMLRSNVVVFRNNAHHNSKFIVADLEQEKKRRAVERSEYGQELKIQGEEAQLAARKVKNVTQQWKLIKDIAGTAGAIVAAIVPEDLRKPFKKYGGPAALVVGGYKAYQWFRSPESQTQQGGAFGGKAWDVPQ